MCSGTSACGNSTAPGSGKMGSVGSARRIRSASSMELEPTPFFRPRAPPCARTLPPAPGLDAHRVEAAPDEDHRNGEEDGGEHEARAGLHLRRQLDGEEAEEGG